MYKLSHKKRKSMDQPSLSLKLFKKQQSKAKEKTLFLKRKRKNKKASYSLKNKPSPLSNKKALLLLHLPTYTQSKKGQVLIESLFVIISLLAFLLAVQFFQSSARKEIQKQRLAKEKAYKAKTPKAPWHR